MSGPSSSNKRKRRAASSSFPSSSLASEDDQDGDQHVRPECPVCFSEMQEPKVLHCGHNLCEECPSKLMKRRKITCPLCKKETSIGSGGELATNFGMKDSIAKTEEMAAEIQEVKEQLRDQTHKADGLEEEKCKLEKRIAELEANLAGPRRCCGKNWKYSEMFVCLEQGCVRTLRYNDYTWLSTDALCSLCVCLKHHQHEIVKYEEAANIFDIDECIETLRKATEQLDTEFKEKLPNMVLTEFQSRVASLLALITDPKKPLLKTDLDSVAGRIDKLAAKTKDFVEKLAAMRNDYVNQLHADDE